MKNLVKIILLWLFLPLLLAGVELRVVTTGDLHGQLPVFSRLAVAIQNEKPDILIDCGDLFSGNYYSDSDCGRSMVEALNLLEFDVWVPGNHDFELPFDKLRELFIRFRGSVLGNWQSRQLPEVLPYTIITRKGFRCAVIGMGDAIQDQRLLPGTPFTMTAARKFLEKTLAEISDFNPDVVILALHRGLYSSAGDLFSLLKYFPQISLVLGGHTHQGDPGRNLGDAYYLQAPSHAHGAAVAVLEIDKKSRRINNIESWIIPPEKEKFHPGVMKLYRELKNLLDVSGQKVIATIPGGLKQEKGFNNQFAVMAAESLRSAAKADAGIFTGSVSGKSRSEKINEFDLFYLMPFRSEIITVRLTRAELANLLKEEMRLSRGKKSFMSSGISGVKFRQVRKSVDPVSLPSEITIAMGSYRFCASKALAGVRRDQSRWRRTGISERDAFREYIIRKFPERKK